MLFLVHDTHRWGYGIHLVRAESKEEALKLACPEARDPEVIELSPEGPPGILWEKDESPDSVRDSD